MTGASAGSSPPAGILDRIRAGLSASAEVLGAFTPGWVEARRKEGGSPVTEADLLLDDTLRRALENPGEGWLSEETEDGAERLRRRHVWVVDPIDGTEEFVAGIPEWCVSIGFVEDGRAVAGGVYNHATGMTIVGSAEEGVWVNGSRARVTPATRLGDALILASRSEVRRGEWKRFTDGGLNVRPTGSVAWKLGLVAAGLADATWTLTPKHEWDVAAGTALVQASGGEVRTLDWKVPKFNNESPRLDGLVACAPGLLDEIASLLERKS